MGRWEADAPGRLQRAALELYAERGFEQVTVAEIAARAGLTERTFFRHFADKREVLFSGSESLQELLVNAVTDAPEAVEPLDAVTEAFETAASLFEDRREFSLQRQAVISANPGLRERELIKLAGLAEALASALRQRGVTDPAANLAGEAGIAVFKIAYERWIEEANELGFAQVIRESFDALRAVAGGASGSRTPR